MVFRGKGQEDRGKGQGARGKGDNLLTRLLVNSSQKDGFRAKRGFSFGLVEIPQGLMG